jgi:hypothetical protein
MTKYYEEQNRIEIMREQQADLPIAISTEKYEGAEKPELICPSCQYITKQKYGVDYEYMCNHCGHIFDPAQEEMRTKSKLSVRGSRDKESRVAYAKDPNEVYMNKNEVEVKGGLKALKDKGLKITHYKEGVG